MPRRTHPRARSKHPRAHARHHRARSVARRWRLAKMRFAHLDHVTEGWTPLPKEAFAALRAITGQRGPVFHAHPEVARTLVREFGAAGPYRNPGYHAKDCSWITCSCPLCKPEKHDASRRAREKRRWRNEELGA